MKLGFFKVKSFFAILLITVSFSANSTVIFEISGVTAGVPFPGYHSIYKNSAELTSNYGFSLDSIKDIYLGLDLTGYNYYLNESELALFETNIGTETIVDNDTGHYLSVVKDAYIVDVLTEVKLYSGTLSIESEYVDSTESTDGFGLFTMSFDAPLAVPQAVPEPGVIVLFSLGLAGLGFVRKRKQSQLK